MKAKSGQSWFDLSVQATGSIEAAFMLANASGCSLTDTPPSNTELPEPEVKNKRVKDYYTRKGVIPATLFIDASPHGIGIDRIGIDFQIL